MLPDLMNHNSIGITTALSCIDLKMEACLKKLLDLIINSAVHALDPSVRSIRKKLKSNLLWPQAGLVKGRSRRTSLSQKNLNQWLLPQNRLWVSANLNLKEIV